MASRKGKWRWVSPDGGRGRWRRSAVDAMIAAVSIHHSIPAKGITVTFDVSIAALLWPKMAEQGWVLELDPAR